MSHYPISECSERDEPCDLVSVLARLPQSGNGLPGTYEELKSFVDSAPTAPPVHGWIEASAGRLRDLAAERWAASIGARLNKIKTADSKTPLDARTALARLQDEIDALLARGEKINRRSLADGTPSMLSIYNDAYLNKTDAVSTGIEALDCLLFGGGFRKQQVAVMAAPPSVGKSSLAGTIAINAALKGKRVHVVTLEMGYEELYQRYHARISKVNLWEMQPGKMTDKTKKKLEDTAGKMIKLPITLDDRSSTLTEIRRSIRNACRVGKADLVVLDYLQLIDGGAKGNKTQDVTLVSQAIKQMARRYEVPIILLSQLSRQVYANGGRAEINHLRESGQIEADADVIIFIDPADGDAAAGYSRYRKFILRVAKQRSGPRDVQNPVMFDGGLFKFFDDPDATLARPMDPSERVAKIFQGQSDGFDDLFNEIPFS